MQAVNVVIAIDENYQNMAEVFLKSLCSYQQNLKIFICSQHDLNHQFKQNIYHALTHETSQIIDVVFVVIDISQQNFQDNGYISTTTYLRYYIEDLFPLGISHYWLYLDVDMLVVQYILEPFNHPKFNHYAVACVSDVFVNKNPEHVKKISGTDYFNAGVLYINAEKWLGSKEKLLDITHKYQNEFLYGDQDALNMLFKNSWLKLPTEYNTQFDHQLESPTNNKTAKILHFTGPNKPIYINPEQQTNYPNLARYHYYQSLNWQDIFKIKTIAVITSTIGREELERAILSVQTQIYPCKHYVFVDGEQYFDKVKPLQEKYPNVIFTYLPMNTGANGWTNSHINAIAPFLIKEDIICYLDDDNWYDNNHTLAIIQGFKRYEQIDVVYNLRRLMKQNGEYLCDDNRESLGLYSISNTYDIELDFNGILGNIKFISHRSYLVDTNCLAMTVKTAREFANHWVKQKNNDYHVWSQCIQHKKRIVATGQRTVNYILSPQSIELSHQVISTFQCSETQLDEIIYLLVKNANLSAQQNIQSNYLYWHQPSLYIDGDIVLL